MCACKSSMQAALNHHTSFWWYSNDVMPSWVKLIFPYINHYFSSGLCVYRSKRPRLNCSCLHYLTGRMDFPCRVMDTSVPLSVMQQTITIKNHIFISKRYDCKGCMYELKFGCCASVLQCVSRWVEGTRRRWRDGEVERDGMRKETAWKRKEG